MSILDAEKIFVDPSEEITSVIDSFLHRTKEKVVLVIPQNSLILSSFITLKVLYREVLKSNKIAIIVTEDSYGLNIAQKAGFVAVARISQVTSDLWDIAFSKKIKAKDALRVKVEPVATEKEENKEESANQSSIDNVEESEIQEPAEDIKEVENVEELASQSLVQEEPKLNNVEIEPLEDEVKKESIDQKLLRPKKLSKLVEVEGIEILVGGDIDKIEKPEKSAKMEDLYFNNDMEQQDRVVNAPRISGSSFTGRDFTKKIKKEGFLSNFFKNRGRKRRTLVNIDGVEKPKSKLNPKSLGIIFGAVVGVVALATLFILSSASVDVLIKIRPEGIKELMPENIKGDTLSTQLNIEQKIIPVVEYKVDDVNASRTGEANGVGRRGTKSKGVVTIYNTYTDPNPTAVNLPAGTKMKNVGSDLYYVLTSDVNLPAPTKNGSGIYDTPIAEDVAVEAIDFGPQYNLEDPGATNNFLVDGFESSKVRVTKFTPFSGGTVEQFVAVSKENIDKLKSGMLPDLQKQAEAKLINLAPQGFIIIANSIKITENKVESVPAEGQESKDKTFNLNLSLNAKGYAVRKDYVDELAKTLLLANKEENENIDIEEIKESVVTLVSENANILELTLSSKGSFKNILDSNKLKDDIAGKSIEEAKSYFKSNPDIAENRITYTPFFIPAFLQRIPTDTGRISITIQ